MKIKHNQYHGVFINICATAYSNAFPFTWYLLVGRSIIVKKGDGSQVKESTDSSTTLEDDDIKGKNDLDASVYYINH